VRYKVNIGVEVRRHVQFHTYSLLHFIRLATAGEIRFHSCNWLFKPTYGILAKMLCHCTKHKAY